MAANTSYSPSIESLIYGQLAPGMPWSTQLADQLIAMVQAQQQKQQQAQVPQQTQANAANPLASLAGGKAVYDIASGGIGGGSVGAGAGGGAVGAGVGAPPAMPNVISAGWKPATSWLDSLTSAATSPLALGTAALAGTAIGNKALSNSPQMIQQGWMASNPLAAPVSLASGGRWKDVLTSGGKLNPAEQVGLALPTAGYSLLHNSLFGQGGMFGSGKSSAQRRRDKFRKQLASADITHDGGIMDLPGGETFDFSSGNPDYRIGYGDSDYQKGKVNYDRYGDTIGALQPLGALMGGKSRRLGNDITGYFVNAASRSSDSKATADYLYNTFAGPGMEGRNKAYEAVLNSKTISSADKPAYLAAIDKQYNVENPNQGKGGEAEFGSAVYPMMQKTSEKAMKALPGKLKNKKTKEEFLNFLSGYKK